MAQVAIKLLLLFGVLSTVSAQFDEYTDEGSASEYIDPFPEEKDFASAYIDPFSGSGSGDFGDPTLVDHEIGGDDYGDDYDFYELPLHDPLDVDVCTAYPEGMPSWGINYLMHNTQMWDDDFGSYVHGAME